MEPILELLFQMLCMLLEVMVQLFPEFMAELGMRSVLETMKGRREINPWLAWLGYVLYGAGVGVLSLIVFPKLLIASPMTQKVNLFVTPLLCGWIMAWYGRYRTRKGQEIIRLDSFFYGFLFAFAMALVRYGYHHFGLPKWI